MTPPEGGFDAESRRLAALGARVDSDDQGRPLDASTLASLGARVDFHECIPCGGKCCRMPWTVFATPRDLARLEKYTDRQAREFADVKCEIAGSSSWASAPWMNERRPCAAYDPVQHMTPMIAKSTIPTERPPLF